MLVSRCIVCDEPLKPSPGPGRPRLYCSDRCREKAKRARRAALRAAPDAREVVGLTARDPDEAVVESVILARSAAASFGVSAKTARPQLAIRCERMADHIAAGLRQYFKVSP